MAKTQIGILHPYADNPSQPKRITSSALKECVRDAIGEPHIDLSITISRVYGGEDAAEQMLADCLDYRKFIDDGMANPRNGLKLSAVEKCKTLLDFEQKIEAWYKSNGWTVIKDSKS
jgi:hypothetical protein